VNTFPDAQNTIHRTHNKYLKTRSNSIVPYSICKIYALQKAVANIVSFVVNANK
jgi:hypothetical protein